MSVCFLPSACLQAPRAPLRWGAYKSPILLLLLLLLLLRITLVFLLLYINVYNFTHARPRARTHPRTHTHSSMHIHQVDAKLPHDQIRLQIQNYNLTLHLPPSCRRNHHRASSSCPTPVCTYMHKNDHVRTSKIL